MVELRRKCFGSRIVLVFHTVRGSLFFFYSFIKSLKTSMIFCYYVDLTIVFDRSFTKKVLYLGIVLVLIVYYVSFPVISGIGYL